MAYNIIYETILMNFFAARQPILDKHKTLFAYELLFRDSVNNVFPEIDGDEATSKMIEASQFNSGMSGFTGGKPAFINFTLETLSKGYLEMISPNEVVVEILETVKPGKKLLAICKKLHDKGYTIALDDYEHQKVWLHFFPFIKIIKLDIRQSTQGNIDAVLAAVKNFPHIKLLAEKVETHEEYNRMLNLGFDYFQGYFFAKPEMISTNNLSPSQIALAELLYETSKSDINLDSITAIFERDVSLSFKLLRYANSATFKRLNEISTIKQAVVILGSGELKRFIGLMFAITANPKKPSELINLAMIRAKFCELVVQESSLSLDTSVAFLTGLLSMIDAILDEELSAILDKLPLSKEIKNPLLNKAGVMSAVIKLIEFIEQAKWEETNIVIKKLKLDKDKVVAHYSQALAWADEQSQLTV